MRVLILQYAGDYRDAFKRLAAGGVETYHAQKYSVDVVTRLRQQVESVTFLCAMSPEPYDELLENGVRAIAAGCQKQLNPQRLLEIIKAQSPTHLILQEPIPEILRWAVGHRVRTLVVLSNYLKAEGIRGKLRNWQFTRLLNHPQVAWVGSYGLTSCQRLQELGVQSDKIIPWDFLVSETPGSLLPKRLLPGVDQPFTIIYVGSLTEEKGVGDLLQAIACLRQRQIPVRAKLVGKGQDQRFVDQAQHLQISDVVEFVGMVSAQSVEPLMRAADAVVVPSRHNYPEGFPLVLHHALCARTPIVASDHPMFRQHLQHGQNAIIFPAGNANRLAACIEKLMANAELYWQLSSASYQTWYQIRLPVKWGDLLQAWLYPTADNQRWLWHQRLTTMSRMHLDARSHQPSQINCAEPTVGETELTKAASVLSQECIPGPSKSLS